MGFDQTSNASRLVKWVFDPFVDERDRFVTYTHGLGGPCYGRGYGFLSISPQGPGSSGTRTAKIHRSAAEKNRSLGKKLASHPIREMFQEDLIRSVTRLG